LPRSCREAGLLLCPPVASHVYKVDPSLQLFGVVPWNLEDLSFHAGGRECVLKSEGCAAPAWAPAPSVSFATERPPSKQAPAASLWRRVRAHVFARVSLCRPRRSFSSRPCVSAFLGARNAAPKANVQTCCVSRRSSQGRTAPRPRARARGTSSPRRAPRRVSTAARPAGRSPGRSQKRRPTRSSRPGAPAGRPWTRRAPRAPRGSR
jgi:hypothetical protein